MSVAEATGPRPTAADTFIHRLVARPAALVPALIVVSLVVLWAAHNGGYDADTWSWGALVVLALTATTLIALGSRRARLTRAGVVALSAFGCFVAWSYLSMVWAESPGWALEGSNRALLYLLVFGLFLVLPWTTEAALVTALVFALGVGTIAIVTLFRIASGNHIQQLAIDGRLAAPTGYFNSSVALFMTSALLATALASRRELPGPLRGTLLAIACASLQLCVMGQSRGWLFTLPLVLVVSILLMPDRLRMAAAAVLPLAGTLVPIHTLLHAFPGQDSPSLGHVAARAGHASLLICAGVLVLGTCLAWADSLVRAPRLSRAGQRRIGVAVTLLVLGAAGVGAVAATHGDPVGFVKRQWHGFIHQKTAGSGGSHFGAVGSGRYDFWRVSLKAVAAHPLGGLGQDNFADYYVRRRRTGEEPRWTHSLEMRLLAHTGIVGFLLFATFLVAAITAALPAIRHAAGLTRAVAAAALLPLVVWVIHGSVDWFWEFPALAGSALGFLGMSAAFGARESSSTAMRAAASHSGDVAGPAAFAVRAPSRHPGRVRILQMVALAGATLAFVACVLVLALPYLSVRELSTASDIRQRNPGMALDRLATAADLNPLSPDPVRLAGTIALETDQFTLAEKHFRETISREPGGWFAWLGDGLAASALGQRTRAYNDFRTAASINSQQSAIKQALARVYTRQPLTATEALKILAVS